MPTESYPVHGAGLGLKRALMGPLTESGIGPVDFFEVAPENWIGVGGSQGKQFREFTERYAFVSHGLSLSIGGPDPLDEDFVRKVGHFLKQHNIHCYSEHLSYCSDGGHLYDLMPIPFTEEAVHYVAERIKRVQDILNQRIAMENISYYAAPGQEMSEIDFINAVVDEADCDLLLDVNNIHVNSVNHKYDADTFLAALPGDRVAYCHIAGHFVEDEDLLVDTHGATVIDSVWGLLHKAYDHFGVMPTLLERDFNLPPLAELLGEVEHIATIQQQHGDKLERHYVSG
ncbi:MAG: DUF692 domain-containing protein [Proteobacteria bacterium]|nr:DUF692 domain-containing protein [Pseudomonadota bacterium]